MFTDTIFETFANIFNTYKIVSIIVSAVFLVLVVRLIILTDAFGGYKRYKLDIYKYGGEEKKRVPEVWKKVISLMRSKNPEDWKQAVLLAEGMFADMMKIETMGEKDIGEFEQLREVREHVFLAIQAEEPVEMDAAKELLLQYRAAFKKLGYL